MDDGTIYMLIMEGLVFLILLILLIIITASLIVGIKLGCHYGNKLIDRKSG